LKRLGNVVASLEVFAVWSIRRVHPGVAVDIDIQRTLIAATMLPAVGSTIVDVCSKTPADEWQQNRRCVQ